MAAASAEAEERAAEQDRAFLARLRAAVEAGDVETVELERLNQTFGGPKWMRIAAERALDKFFKKVI